jgi:hypothetical protein
MRTPSWDRAVRDANAMCAAVRRRENPRLYQFCDPFDTYNSASAVYETVAGTPVYSSSYARFAAPAGLPGQGMYLPSGAYVRKNMQSNQATLITKVAYRGLSTPSSFTSIIGLLDGNSSANQVAIGWNNAGAIEVINGYQHVGGGAVVATSGPSVIAPLQWFGVEVLCTINGSAGVLQVWVNGAEVLNLISLNTQFTSNAWANQVQLADSTNPGAYFDDFRVYDNTGSTNNAPIGSGFDSRLLSKLGSGPGGLTQWTPNGASANWQCTDDNPPDGDSTYVSSTGLNYDAYALPPAGIVVPPFMVVARSYYRKDDGAVRTFQNGVRSGTSNALGSVFTAGSSYAWADSCIPNDPATGLPWTGAGADAAQHLKYEAS